MFLRRNKTGAVAVSNSMIRIAFTFACLAFVISCRGDEADGTRAQLARGLGIPAERVPLDATARGQIEHEGVVIEKWIFTAEPGSRVPALIYRPKTVGGRAPAVVFTYGHGSSKSAWSYHYAGMLYAKLGIIALAIDPIGEEERHATGRMGSRAHDNATADQRAAAAGRLMMGKLVFDTMRGVDLLAAREDVDMRRVGVAGYSLGGAKACWMAALETRLRAALVCGWAYDDIVLPTKSCTRASFTMMRERIDWPAFIRLAAPHCAIFTGNGDIDDIIDRGDHDVWRRSDKQMKAASPAFAPGMLESHLVAGGGHRPYFIGREALFFLARQLDLPEATRDRIDALPMLNLGDWCDTHHIALEKLYGTRLHWRGATAPDLGIMPLSPEQLAVLHPEEKGAPDFTLEGWLDQIEGKR